MGRGGLLQLKGWDQMPVTLAIHRVQINADGSPSQTVAAGYRWMPGTELNDPMIREQAPFADKHNDSRKETAT